MKGLIGSCSWFDSWFWSFAISYYSIRSADFPLQWRDIGSQAKPNQTRERAIISFIWGRWLIITPPSPFHWSMNIAFVNSELSFYFRGYRCRNMGSSWCILNSYMDTRTWGVVSPISEIPNWKFSIQVRILIQFTGTPARYARCIARARDPLGRGARTRTVAGRRE